MTYLAVNAVFLAVVVIVLVVTLVRSRRSGLTRPFVLPAIAATAVLLIVLTAIFDNIMIAVGLVGYDPERIAGVFVGIAPFEDFGYAVAAVLLLPCLWALLPAAGPRKDRR